MSSSFLVEIHHRKTYTFDSSSLVKRHHKPSHVIPNVITLFIQRFPQWQWQRDINNHTLKINTYEQMHINIQCTYCIIFGCSGNKPEYLTFCCSTWGGNYHKFGPNSNKRKEGKRKLDGDR